MFGMSFEEKQDKIIKNIVGGCYDYVEGKADYIYIYLFLQNGERFANFYYCINGMFVKKHKLNDVCINSQNNYDISVTAQKKVNNAIMDNIAGLIELYNKYSKNSPNEIKIICDVKESSKNKYSLKVDYSYEEKKRDEFGPFDFADEWFESLKENK